MSINVERSSEYREWLQAIKTQIKSSRNNVALAVNNHLIELYWELGKQIVDKITNANWGAKIIELVSVDLKHEFPEIKGFSRRNLYAIKQWYEFYSLNFEFVPQAVAQLPWGHNRLIVAKIKEVPTAIFYSEEAIKNGWSRDVLENQIEGKLISRKANSTHNFDNTLPGYQSKIAEQVFKDPYNFDFLGLQEDALEREIENELTSRITEFLLELGKGFAYVGKQYKIEVSQNDYFLDLLFYHLELRCYIVIEIKSGRFKPEYAGKLNFYLSAADSQLKKTFDNASIGILLCRKKDKIEAEYSLRDINKPMGISEYKLTEAIPDDIKSKLPTIEELEHDLNDKLNKQTTES